VKKSIKPRVVKNLTKFVLDPFGVSFPKKAYLRYLNDGKYIHFFHIGRCAGTTIKAFIEQFNKKSQSFTIMAHEHKVGLSDIPQDSCYFFSIRDPIDRFYSAFYWRKGRRNGAGPLQPSDSYSEQERKAFSRFKDANDLAESLFADGVIGIHAFTAMQEIKHVNRPQHFWFSNVEEVFILRPPLCIIRPENMHEDLDVLASKFDIILPEQQSRYHQNTYLNTTPLSSLAIENLRRWYAADIHFYELAKSWIALNQKNQIS
jgi:hypothetical protein